MFIFRVRTIKESRLLLSNSVRLSNLGCTFFFIFEDAYFLDNRPNALAGFLEFELLKTKDLVQAFVVNFLKKIFLPNVKEYFRGFCFRKFGQDFFFLLD